MADEENRLASGWDEAVDGYEQYYVPRFAPWVGAAVDALVAGPLPDGPILVPACGTFPELARLDAALPGREVVGLDLSAGMVRRARERAEGHPSVTVVQGDAMTLDPEWTSRFAGVVSVFGLQQMPDPEQAIRSWVRAVRPGGRLSVVFWPRDNDTDGPFALMSRVLSGNGPATDRSWEDRLTGAFTGAGAQIESDERLAYEMRHADAASAFDAHIYSGPMRPLVNERGPDFVDARRSEYLSDAPSGPWVHHPVARRMVAVNQN